MQNKKISLISISLWIFAIIFLIYSVADFSASIQTGYRNADRSNVHMYLIIITAFLFVFFLCRFITVRRISPIFISLFICAVWTVSVNLFNGITRWTFLIQCNYSVLWMLSFFFFKEIRKSENKNDKGISVFSLLFYLFYIVYAIYLFFDMQLRLGRTPVISMAYYPIALVPWLLIRFPQKRQLIFLISAITALLSMKRGAIVAIVLMFVIDGVKSANNKKAIVDLLKKTSFIVCFVLAIVIIDNQFGNFLSFRFSIDSLKDGSGRMQQYKYVFKEIGSQSIGELIFGIGCEEFLYTYGISIHNEWLAFFYNYGLIGFLAYLNLFCSMCIEVRRENNQTLKLAALAMIVLFLTLSTVSAVYTGYVGIWVFGFWGYYNAESQKTNWREESL